MAAPKDHRRSVWVWTLASLGTSATGGKPTRPSRTQPTSGSTRRYPNDVWIADPYFRLKRRMTLDLNYLFHRQQVERARADGAENDEARAAHEELAKRYEERIEEVTGDEFQFPKSADLSR